MICENAVKQRIDEKLKDRQWYSLVTDCMYRMNNNFYPSHEVDFVVQRWRGNYDIYDAYHFALFHTWVASGKLIGCTIEVGEAPFNNAAVKANNDVLSNLFHPFSARFWGEFDTSDGIFEWHEPIQMDCTPMPTMTGQSFIQETVRPRTVPLEVGYTDAGTTWQHVASNEWGLARWPYGYKDIIVWIPRGRYPGVNMP